MKHNIENLINFEISKGVITARDYTYVKNQLYSLLGVELTNQSIKAKEIKYPSDALNPILDILEKNDVINGTVIERDLYDSKIMNVFAKLPSTLQKEFDNIKKEDNKKATKFLYNYVTNLNYIRRNRVMKNIGFTRPSKYGFLEITINLSKPEKDPKSIALAGKQKSVSYPKCVLCKENEGFAGNYQRASRNEHRLIEFELMDESWFFQYSPYTYYNEHTIVFSGEHHPMSINDNTFKRLTNLTDKFDGYFFGSNADLPIVGGSILSHEHYQGGNHKFPIEEVEIIHTLKVEDIEIQIVKWPLSTVRLKGKNKDTIQKYATKILKHWQTYNNEELDIISHSNTTPHHTVTPIARKKMGVYELDLILRDNRTNEEHPMGIFHPHSDKWNIKKENIGLIEAIGLAILPGRLKEELEVVKNHIINNKPLTKETEKHRIWINTFKDKANKDNIDEIIETELALVFERILEDCGVFKLNDKGINAFKKFISEASK